MYNLFMKKRLKELFSSPNDLVDVPDFQGIFLSEALKIIEERGFFEGKIQYVENEKFLPNTVLNQSPKEGTKVSQGSKVKETVTPQVKKKQGFGVIELLVVVAIIGIISSVTMVNLSKARKKSRIVKTVSDLNYIKTAIISAHGAENKKTWWTKADLESQGVNFVSTSGDPNYGLKTADLDQIINKNSGDGMALSEFLKSSPQAPLGDNYSYMYYNPAGTLWYQVVGVSIDNPQNSDFAEIDKMIDGPNSTRTTGKFRYSSASTEDENKYNIYLISEDQFVN